MDKKLIDRIWREGLVDADGYRYRIAEKRDATHQWGEVQRIALEKLGTTAVYHGWETVEVIN